MTVEELIGRLKQLPSDAEIVLQKDAEGNGYSPLSDVDYGFYFPETTWCGEFYDKSWDADDCCMSDEDWEEMHNGPVTVVLYPVN